MLFLIDTHPEIVAEALFIGQIMGGSHVNRSSKHPVCLQKSTTFAAGSTFDDALVDSEDPRP